MLFQCPGGVSVPAPSAQKRAISVCSGDRVEPAAAPSARTSARSSRYSALSKGGGPDGRKVLPDGVANGMTNPQCGSRYAAKPGVVGCHTPNPVPEGGLIVRIEPSFARS